jgi:hypothetical protein
VKLLRRSGKLLVGGRRPARSNFLGGASQAGLGLLEASEAGLPFLRFWSDCWVTFVTTNNSSWKVSYYYTSSLQVSAACTIEIQSLAFASVATGLRSYHHLTSHRSRTDIATVLPISPPSPTTSKLLPSLTFPSKHH